MTLKTTGLAVGVALMLCAGAGTAAAPASPGSVARTPLPLVAGAPVARVVVRAKRPDTRALAQRPAAAPLARGQAPCPAGVQAG